MLIGGLQKTTLIDFPGRVASTVFTVGCNFRCPFCHNKDLVSLRNFNKSSFKQISEEEIFQFLGSRKRILDGVCITGGEPTIQEDLSAFCQKIKDLGLEVKIDTNGTKPNIIKKLIKEGLVDFISMDIKTSFENYQVASGVKFNIEKIKESIKIIVQSKIEREFRITVVPTIHKKEDLLNLASQLKKIDDNIFLILQSFQPKNCLDSKYNKKKPFTSKEMKSLLKTVRKTLHKSKIRGEEA